MTPLPLKSPSRPSFDLENSFLARGLNPIGVDEVGRGCLAGPVVAAAVMFPNQGSLKQIDQLSPFDLHTRSKSSLNHWWAPIKDSKLLSAKVRERLDQEIRRHCLFQIAWCSPQEIDQMNILRASLEAMRRCLWPFRGLGQAVLVDGHIDPYRENMGALPDAAHRLGFEEVLTVIKGDQKSVSIAAASIVAKVFRDHWMTDLHEIYPHYGFAKHKGYPTGEHQAALRSQGISPIHRLSFSMGPKE